MAEINSELLEYFLQHICEQTSKSQATINNIKRDVSGFLQYLADENIDAPKAKYLKDYALKLRDDYSESSFLTKLSHLRQFANWLNFREDPFKDLYANIEAQRSLRRKKTHYAVEEIVALNEQLKGDDRTLEYLIVNLIYELSISNIELINLNLSDYNAAVGDMKVREAELAFSPTLQKRLRNYMQNMRCVEGEVLALNDPLLLSGQGGKRLSLTEIRQVLLGLNLKSNYLRKSKIINMLEAGLPSAQVEQQLNLKLNTTYKSFAKSNDYRLINAYKQYHPRSGL